MFALTGLPEAADPTLLLTLSTPPPPVRWRWWYIDEAVG